MIQQHILLFPMTTKIFKVEFCVSYFIFYLFNTTVLRGYFQANFLEYGSAISGECSLMRVPLDQIANGPSFLFLLSGYRLTDVVITRVMYDAVGGNLICFYSCSTGS